MIAMSLNDPRVQRMHNVTGLRCTIVLLLGQLAPFIRDTNPAVRRQKMTEDRQKIDRKKDIYSI